MTRSAPSPDRAPPSREPNSPHDVGVFARKCVVAILIASLAFVLWHIKQVLVIAFAAIVIATILLAAARPIRLHTPLSHRASLVAAGLLIILVVGLAGLVAWPQLQSQSSDLLTRLPEAILALEEQLGLPLTQSLENMTEGGGMFGSVLKDFLSMAGTLTSVLTGIILVVVAGAFLAGKPRTYRRGLVLLVPPAHHERFETALERTGESLKLWLVGQLTAMAIVGGLVAFGAWLIGLPSPLALGLIAFFFEFVPLIGAIFGALPGLLMAVSEGGSTLAWTVLLYLAVQQLELNMITPLVLRRMVDVPPALFLLSVLAMSALFGMLGILVAGPLTVAIYVLVRALYVEGALDETLEKPGPGDPP